MSADSSQTRRQGNREFLALMAAASSTVAIAIDAMLPAFGSLRSELGLAADSSAAALVVTVFVAGIGIGQLIYGPLADRYGRKPVFVAGLVIYAVAGLTATAATSLNGALISPLIDTRISSTVTPFAIGSLSLAIVATAAVFWAERSVSASSSMG